jgi:hypothetical protein
MVKVARSHPFRLGLPGFGGLGDMVLGSTAVARSLVPSTQEREAIPTPLRGPMNRIVLPIEFVNIFCFCSLSHDRSICLSGFPNYTLVIRPLPGIGGGQVGTLVRNIIVGSSPGVQGHPMLCSVLTVYKDNCFLQCIRPSALVSSENEVTTNAGRGWSCCGRWRRKIFGLAGDDSLKYIPAVDPRP